jgi:cell division protein FtsW
MPFLTKNKPIDKMLLTSFLLLLIPGFFVFISASFGVLANDSNKFNSMTFNHLFFGLFLGLIACIILSKIDHKFLRKYSFYFFLLSVIFTLMVFVPGVGMTLKGATRWINVFGVSIQPVEFLKIGFLIYWAAWLAYTKDKIQTFKYGLLPFIIMMSIIGLVLLFQPDFDAFLIFGTTALSMFVVAGAKWKHIGMLAIIAVVISSIFLMTNNYALDRVKTFFTNTADSQNSGYQINQSTIAIGSGQLFGRGYGQGIQKFRFLPETMSDSIFAVIGEETGFIGSLLIIVFFLFFLFSGIRISRQSADSFGGLLAFGIVILILTQSFLNIGSMLGVVPLAGTPLVFFSHGGTAMMSSLIMIGILLSISRHKTTGIRIE